MRLDVPSLRRGRKKMTEKEKILESIKRLDDLPPSKWDAPTIINVKKFLFPKIVSYIEGAEKFAEQVSVFG